MKVLDDIKVIIGKEDESGKANKPEAPKKILIVEDEKALAGALEAEFQDKGFDVIKAENGQEGLDKVIADKPDIILLDLLMPVMDGKTMLRNLRKIPQFKTLPVIVLTNAGEVDNIRQTQFYDNAIEFLIKSNISIDEIVTHVKRLIL